MQIDAESTQALLGKPTRRPEAVEWDSVKNDLGTDLPSDYKYLIENYPALIVNGFIRIYHPTARAEHMRLLDQVYPQLDGIRRVMLPAGRLKVPYNLHPDLPGLLPWGRSLNGDYCFWLTGSDPSAWRVVISDLVRWWEFDGGLLEFLSATLRRQVRCPIFPDDFPDDEETYQEE